MAAPVVQSLQDIIGQITAAQAPEQAQIDKNISNNDQSGGAQVAGLNSAQDNAFSKINQEASNKGMYFSGYTPSSEAAYTGSTYLPALAKVQQAIATTRNSLLGQKASLTTQANTQALTTQQGQQKELDAYNSQQEQIQAQKDLEAQREAAAAQQAQIAASRAAATAQAKQPTMQESILQGLTSMYQSKQPAFYAENVLAPAVAQAYGITKDAALSYIYPLRKQYFGE